MTFNRHPYVNVLLTDSNVRINPTDVVSFQVKKLTGMAYNTFSLVVQEKDHYSLSREIGDKKLRLRITYGDTIQESQTLYGEILSYQSEMRGVQMFLTITGWVSIVEFGTDRPQVNWTTEHPELHNNPSEIIKFIADKNGWVVEQIEPTIPLRKLIDSAIKYDKVKSSSTEWGEVEIKTKNSDWSPTRELIQDNENDIQFINSVLKPVSISRNSFMTEYSLDVSSKSGQIVVSYKPIGMRRVKKNLFFAYNQPDGTFGQKEVISFNSGLNEIFSTSAKVNSSKTVQDAFDGTIGAQSYDTTGLQQMYEVMWKARAKYRAILERDAEDNASSDEESAELVEKYIKYGQQYQNIYEKASELFMSIYYNDKIKQADANRDVNTQSDNLKTAMAQMEDFGALSLYKYKATLTTLGVQGNNTDVNGSINSGDLVPGDCIDILVMLKYGPHYTSGTYLILDQTDDISLGKYTSTFNLMKDSSKFFGSAEELADLGLSLSDVFHSSYDSEIVANESAYTEVNTRVTNTVNNTNKSEVYGPQQVKLPVYGPQKVEDSGIPLWKETTIIKHNNGIAGGVELASLPMVASTRRSKPRESDELEEMEITQVKMRSGKWPGIDIKSYSLQELSQKVEMYKSGTQLQNFPKKIKVAFFNKPYIGKYQNLEHQNSGISTTMYPVVFRCTKEFRRYMPLSSPKSFYLVLADGTKIVNGQEEPIFNTESLQRKVRIFYAGDEVRIASKEEYVYGDNGSPLSGYVVPGRIIKEGEILQRKDGVGYITSADVEIYCPGSVKKIFGIDMDNISKPKEMWVSLRSI